MTALLFAPTSLPDEELAIDREPRVLSARFGNGYVLDAGDGINSILQKGTLKWTNLFLDPEGQYIIDFFEERNGYQRVLYTLPGQAVQRTLKFTAMTDKIHDGIYVDIEIEFEEVPA